jgi:thiol-disulfide isomerase/thioredoxin
MGCVAMAMHYQTPSQEATVKAKCTQKTQDCALAKKKSCCMQAQNEDVAYASLQGVTVKREALPTAEVKFFAGTWKELLAKAEKDKKPFWVDIYTTWCGPCKIMSKFTFTDENVISLSSKSFLAYKIDAEKGEGIKIASDYNIDAYPTVLFFGPDGKLLGREVGIQDAERFAYMMDKYLKKAGKPKKSKK